MLSKLLLGLCLLHVAQSGYWKKVATNICVGAKSNHYKEFTFWGPSSFIIAMKLTHKKGAIGCANSVRSKWGCNDNYPINMIVTDTRNKRIYPSTTEVKLRAGGWYDLPGYGPNTPNLVFADPGFRHLQKGQKMRIWYGEDLYNWHEGDNHGYSCMDVAVYITRL